jgi:CRISPR/Cas system-associated endonuclease Cas1
VRLTFQFCSKLKRKDFTVKTENYSTNRKGKREYLNDLQSSAFVKNLNEYFQTNVSISRMRMGRQQEIETLISEEALLFAQYLRNEKEEWIPRIALPPEPSCIRIILESA